MSMMSKVRFVCALLMALVSTACGVSPHDADEALDVSMEHPEEWCGWKPPSPETMEVEKAFNHPDGYGFTATFGCFEADEQWPGGFCWAPETLVWVTRIHQGTQDSAWYKNLTDTWGAARDRLNARGWDVTRISGGSTITPNMNVHTDSTTTTAGVLGESLQNTWTSHSGFDQGVYWTHKKCDVKLYRARLEANPFYQAATPAQQERYRKNLASHEYWHCFGLAHTDDSNTLMSVSHTFPGPRFDSLLNPTEAQLQMIDEFDPLN